MEETAPPTSTPSQSTAERVGVLHDLLGFPDARTPTFLEELDHFLVLAGQRTDARIRVGPDPNAPTRTWQRFWSDIPRSDVSELRAAERLAARVCFSRFKHIRSRSGVRRFDAGTIQRHMHAAGIQVGASFIRCGNRLRRQAVMESFSRRRQNQTHNPYLLHTDGESVERGWASAGWGEAGWGSGGGWGSGEGWASTPVSTGNWGSGTLTQKPKKNASNNHIEKRRQNGLTRDEMLQFVQVARPPQLVSFQAHSCRMRQCFRANIRESVAVTGNQQRAVYEQEYDTEDSAARGSAASLWSVSALRDGSALESRSLFSPPEEREQGEREQGYAAQTERLEALVRAVVNVHAGWALDTRQCGACDTRVAKDFCSAPEKWFVCTSALALRNTREVALQDQQSKHVRIRVKARDTATLHQVPFTGSRLVVGLRIHEVWSREQAGLAGIAKPLVGIRELRKSSHAGGKEHACLDQAIAISLIAPTPNLSMSHSAAPTSEATQAEATQARHSGDVAGASSSKTPSLNGSIRRAEFDRAAFENSVCSPPSPGLGETPLKDTDDLSGAEDAQKEGS
ncbi:hypothetical protein B0H11DRAFT_1899284 [Mycena galericulata]|nr:hypothetical protein B0H11DRAFT_1899284 [Mycena galericulata]